MKVLIFYKDLERFLYGNNYLLFVQIFGFSLFGYLLFVQIMKTQIIDTSISNIDLLYSLLRKEKLIFRVHFYFFCEHAANEKKIK